MKKNVMVKYGCTDEAIRFEQDDWVLVAPPEGSPGLDCIHGCDREDKIGIKIRWSYQLPGDPECPGCDAIMPDEVQGLFMMANADYVARFPEGWMRQEFERAIARNHHMWTKQMFLSGSGVPGGDGNKITGVTA